MTFEALRILLLAACGFASSVRCSCRRWNRPASCACSCCRFPARTLYAAQAAGALSDPWILICAACRACRSPSGSQSQARGWQPRMSLAAGVPAHPLPHRPLDALDAAPPPRRPRSPSRRAFGAAVHRAASCSALLPGLLATEPDERAGTGHGRRRTSADARMGGANAPEVAYAVVPSELFARATRSRGFARARRRDPAARRAADIGHAAPRARPADVRPPARFSVSRNTTTIGQHGRAIRPCALPFLSRGSAAVAHAQLRLAMRTPRGRSILLSPLVVFCDVRDRRLPQGQIELGFINLADGLSLATFGGAVCLLSILPFAHEPIRHRSLGPDAGAALAARHARAAGRQGRGQRAHRRGPGASCHAGLAFVLFPGGSPALWLSLPPALVATYALAAPGAAALSADLPPHRRSQQHRPRQQRARPRRVSSACSCSSPPALPASSSLCVTRPRTLGRQLTPVVMLRLVWHRRSLAEPGRCSAASR